MQKITPFFMFNGCAEEALHFYLGLFPGSSIQSLAHYGEGEAGPPGTVQLAVFSLGEQLFMCIDSPIPQPFTFTPAMSLYVGCTSLEEIDRLFAALSEGGQVLMPLASYPFSERFAWVQDRFGVSWQLAVA